MGVPPQRGSYGKKCNMEVLRVGKFLLFMFGIMYKAEARNKEEELLQKITFSGRKTTDFYGILHVPVKGMGK